MSNEKQNPGEVESSGLRYKFEMPKTDLRITDTAILSNKFHHSARIYVQMGYKIFPCIPQGKTPLTEHGFKEASTIPAQIDSWWTRWPDANIGLATGNGLVVIDLDSKDGHDAIDLLADLEKEFGEFNTPYQRTGNGMQFLFRSEVAVKCATKLFGKPIDVRGEGGYIIVPPSIHPSGRIYEWDASYHIARMPMARLPEKLEQALLIQDSKPRIEASEWREILSEGVSEGSRNQTLARIAGHLLRRHIDPIVTLELLCTWNEQKNKPPLSEKEVVQIVDSIARKELQRRGA